jgi:YD repeat-containing protein
VLASYTWTYDAAGRLVDMVTVDSTAHYTYDEVDQLTGATYSPLPLGSGLPANSTASMSASFKENPEI